MFFWSLSSHCWATNWNCSIVTICEMSLGGSNSDKLVDLGILISNIISVLLRLEVTATRAEAAKLNASECFTIAVLGLAS